MISAPLIDYLKKGIFTLLGLILAVYLFVILMTYTGNDPSWSHISSDMTTINNMGGATGAWLSDILYSFFGFGAWWLLAFLVYESILIWWDNKPTFWLLRLVAYVFLILSSSALFAQLIALVQQVADPMSSGLKGVAGGIIGLELQARLAQLLSQWGSVTFLAVFVAITATFAFNIHWLSIYEKFKTLSWLGSGIKNQDSAFDHSQTAQESSDIKEYVDKTLISEKAQHEQLPLDLQAADHAIDRKNESRSGRFSNVLNDFLSTSGLGASVKASMAAAAQVASDSARREEQLQTAATIPNHASISNINQASTPVANALITPVRKVEPSFAWNDANTVDDLLASHIATEQDTIPYDAAINAPRSDESAAVFFDSLETDASDAETDNKQPLATNLSSTQPAFDTNQEVIQPATNESSINPLVSAQHNLETDISDLADTAPTVDTLVDAWLAEHAAVPSATKLNKEEGAPIVETAVAPTTEVSDRLMNDLVDKPADGFSNEWSVEKSEFSNDLDSFSISGMTNASKTADVIEPVFEIMDMTPTNTPPANPKLPPTAGTSASISDTKLNIEPENQLTTAIKPTVSFAVPEGDSSNHITDMMPEDDSRAEDAHAPVMPHISDDAAFSQKSRSMQTAAYRSSLSPIPELSILDKPDPNRQPSYTIAELEQLSELLEIKLQEFNVKASVVNAIPGPVVTRFEVDLAAGIKASKVTGISRDLARSLSMASLRVVEVIPGKPYIGIEVPNKQREMVRLIELLDTEKFKDPKAQISMAMGKDIGGKAIITDLARAPHMLVAGTTGSGKSVLVNAMLLSMLLKYTPNELRMILIDPKQLELANYNDIPHLLTPVVTDMTEAASALSWCVAEMERRYQLMSLLKVRKLNEFNKKVIAAEQSGNPMLDPLWRPNDSVSISQAPKLKTLPMIVIVADEFADMIMQVG